MLPGSANASSRAAVDAVAVDVVAICYDVVEIKPDAEPNALFLGLAAFRSTIARCTSTAQRTASTTLPNSTSMPSPVVLTMRPRCSRILASDPLQSFASSNRKRTAVF